VIGFVSVKVAGLAVSKRARILVPATMPTAGSAAACPAPIARIAAVRARQPAELLRNPIDQL